MRELTAVGTKCLSRLRVLCAALEERKGFLELGLRSRGFTLASAVCSATELCIVTSICFTATRLNFFLFCASGIIDRQGQRIELFKPLGLPLLFLRWE